MKQFTPFPIRPIRLGGIYGVTWQLYKRGFVPMLLFTLIFCGVTALASSFLPAPVPLILGILQLALLTPLYQGVVFSEYRQRYSGFGASFKDLFRTCRHGLTHFYGTYWANFLYYAGIVVVFSIIAAVVLFAILLGRGLPRLLQHGFSDQALPQFGYAALIPYLFLLQLLVHVPSVFAALSMPAAAHEGKKGFAALGRSFSLSGRRFGRVLLCTLLPAAISALIGCLPLIFLELSTDLWAQIPAVAIPTVFSLFYQPYWTALCTSLYFDGIARDKEAADKKAAAPLQSAPAAEVTTEDDLNKSAAADQPTPAVLWRAAPEGARLWAAADLCTPAEPVIPAETVDPDETSIVKE